jgi:hypothetical protein
MQFTKLFNSILDSTIWQEPPPTKLVWITMLAMADRNGEVHASIPGLAKRAGVTLSECEHALECLLSPDKYSRTQDHEGRRIKEIDGGFRLLNHGKYRALLSAEERREYNRQKQAEYRASQKRVNDMSMTVNHNKQCAHSTEAEAEAEAEADTEKNPPNPPRGEERAGRNSPKRPTLQEALQAASNIGITPQAAKLWWERREASAWMKGTAGGGTTPIGSWQADMSQSKTWAEDEAKKAPQTTNRKFVEKP